ncbi:response regulator transcription factor [Streptomyces violascens]|uniref:HTH luxR-type domain-containing protein n=1 Tax=Streptomyces violascens TaxID=67381 RepID=A0ABQ3QEF8_9ACTN|nr:response regulator transcription factor [Streptomyces violascens]GGU00784.1 hypothetical protein GCM10010289_21910 [Streptomyces violascens]GHI35681.1 hypothetical protein Sviol_00890 [Streptomyces violascens]
MTLRYINDTVTVDYSCITVGLIVSADALRRRLTRLFRGSGWDLLDLDSGKHQSAPECDVLVVDVDRLPQVQSSTPTAALTYNADVPHIGGVGADVCAIVERDDDDSAFLEAVQEVAAGHGWISPILVRALLRESHRHARTRLSAYPDTYPDARTERIDCASRLTPREREVVALVAQGMNNSEIGNTLFIAESTVNFHMSNILQKTGLRDRSQLAAHVSAQPTPTRESARL